jgi:hypothetical protein
MLSAIPRSSLVVGNGICSLTGAVPFNLIAQDRAEKSADPPHNQILFFIQALLHWSDPAVLSGAHSTLLPYSWQHLPRTLL